MIIWVLTVILAVAGWGFGLYRIHTNEFNFIEYFKSKRCRGRYGDLKESAQVLIGAFILTFILCFVPVVNVIIALVLTGGSYLYPLGRKGWQFLTTVGKATENTEE